MHCIYSTLSFICEHAQRYGITPRITFDQPLWWKALNIILRVAEESPLKPIILRLWGFHAQISFFGCIFHIIDGSGLQHILE